MSDHKQEPMIIPTPDGPLNLTEYTYATHAYLVRLPDGQNLMIVRDSKANAPLLAEKRPIWEKEGYRVEYLPLAEAKRKLLQR
ncbi:hypothetical protein JQK19_14735 [Chromobacterium violaceum]|uniref:hypothetical protein n=1 Tax=Chromobacterium violaceum TaxID=536 RepID=UPI001BEC8504|nr:hypothetical protein [Chromobacterium violaceum]MBT2868497.1 hypothetical protein [Chromobacterium violaceum]